MFTIYVIWPIANSIWLSFFDWDGLGEATWIGMGNYAELMDELPDLEDQEDRSEDEGIVKMNKRIIKKILNTITPFL